MTVDAAEEKRCRILLLFVKTWNDISSVVVCLFCAWGLLKANFAARWVSEDMVCTSAIMSSFSFAYTVAGTAAIFEVVNVVCSRGLRVGIIGEMGQDSGAMLLVYLCLLTFYLLMHAAGDFLVHEDMLAFGGPRPVYSLRYFQWLLNVPMLMVVSGNDAASGTVSDAAGQPWLKPDIENSLWEEAQYTWRGLFRGVLEAPSSTLQALLRMPLAASARLTAIYIVASWMAVVADDLFVRWVLVAVSFSAYMLASLEQLALLFVRYRLTSGPVLDWSGWLLVGQVLLFGFYGGIYLLAIFGLISVRLEQEAYTYSDMMAKVAHSAALLATRRRTEVTQAIQLRNFAVTAAADLQRMISEASVPIFCVDNDLKVTDWNANISSLTGVAQEEARGRKLTELFAKGEDSQWQPVAVELLAAALADAQTDLAHFHFVQQEGTHDVIIVAASAKPQRDRRGEIRGAVCIGQDVTELMLQRQEAQALAAGLTELVDTASVPIFEVNQDLRITEWNSWMAKSVGLSKTKVLDTHLSSLLTPRCRSKFNEVQMLFDATKSDLLELELETNNSKPITLCMNTTSRLDRERNVVGTLYIGQDVTKLKDIDEWKSSMMAMVSHELKSPLHGIIGLSHSLLLDEKVNIECPKKPLAMINNCAKRLLDSVSNMMDASKLVHRRNTVLTRDPVQLSSIVQEVMLLCQEAVDKRGEPALKPSVKIVNAISQPLPVIEADAYRCTQLFFNLISNAVKFTNKGSVTISAAADDVEQYVTVDVRDTGVGIAPDCLERIFQPFDQEDRSEQRHYEGLGLGLAICRQIVAKHGGSLTVTSHKNKGSTFRVKLPYRMKSSVLPLLDNKEQSDTEDGAAGGQPLPNSQPSPAPEAPETTSVADPDDIQLDCRTNPPEQGRLDSITSESVASIASRASFGRQVSEVEKQRMASIRMKTGRTTKEGGEAAWNMLGGHDSWVVLSVDDDMVNQQVMSSLLRSSKYKIEVATHGGEALSYMREHPPPALILMEVMMPGLSGTDVLRTLRKTYSLEVLPIIMISAKSDKETIARCLNLGANDFVQKPFNLAEMFARVNLHCRLARAFRGRGEKMPTVEPQVDDDMVVEKSLLKELLPGELLQAISSAASSTATKVTREVARSRVEEFLSKRESPSTVHADQDMQAKLVKAEKEAKQAVGVMDKLSASQGLMKRGESARLRLLEEEVRKREQCLLHFGQWRDTQTTLPPSCVGEQIVKNVIRAEETLLMKDVNISHILASLPAAEAAELQDTLTRLREETLLLLQESSCKDQLLLDANFRLHMLGMTLVQKDIQLGLR